MPSISVVLPVYNGAATVADTLDSIVAQSFKDFEVVAVDDGSSDDTFEILTRYQRADPRLRVVRTENHGLAYALNTALSQARGEYIARIDADDLCTVDRFAQQHHFLERTPKCIAVGCQVLLVDKENVPLRRQPSVGHGPVLKDRCKGFSHFPPSPPTIPHPTAMMRSSALRAVGGYRTHFVRGSEDRDLWWRLSSLGQICRLPDRLVRYRVHPGSFSAVRRREVAEGALISDLSAAARHFGLDDSSLIAAYRVQSGAETLLAYARLLGDFFPTRALAYFRAKQNKLPELASWVAKRDLRGEVVHHFLTSASLSARWRLIRTAML